MSESQDQTPCLILTGERSEGRHRVLYRGNPVLLTSGFLAMTCHLILAKGRTRTGYLSTRECPLISSVNAHRLRRMFADPFLLETGIGGEYRLSIPLEQIALTADFSELPCGIISARDQAELQSLLCTIQASP